MSAKLNILIVEEAPALLELIGRVLDATTHTYKLARNGKAGLGLFKTEKFYLVITDYIMPEMNGDLMIEMIRQITPRQAFIMISGRDFEPDMVRRFQALGVSQFLAKPFTPTMLMEAIDEACGSIA